MLIISRWLDYSVLESMSRALGQTIARHNARRSGAPGSQWFISTFKRKYTSRNETMGSEKCVLLPRPYTDGPLTQATSELPCALQTFLRSLAKIQTHVVLRVIMRKGPPFQVSRLCLVYCSSEILGPILTGGNIIIKQVGHASLTVSLTTRWHERGLSNHALAPTH